MKTLLALVAGVMGYCYYRGVEARRVRVERHRELTRWEGEGGNVPAVAKASETRH